MVDKAKIVFLSGPENLTDFSFSLLLHSSKFLKITIILGSAQDLDPDSTNFLDPDPDPQKYADPRIQNKNLNCSINRDYKNFLISECFIKFKNKRKNKTKSSKFCFAKKISDFHFFTGPGQN